MSEFDNQGTLPPHVEPGRRTSPRAKDADPESPDAEEVEKERDPDRGSPAKPPFEPSTEGGTDAGKRGPADEDT